MKAFDKEEFEDCSFLSHCPPSPGKQTIFYLNVQQKTN